MRSLLARAAIQVEGYAGLRREDERRLCLRVRCALHLVLTSAQEFEFKSTRPGYRALSWEARYSGGMNVFTSGNEATMGEYVGWRRGNFRRTLSRLAANNLHSNIGEEG